MYAICSKYCPTDRDVYLSQAMSAYVGLDVHSEKTHARIIGDGKVLERRKMMRNRREYRPFS
jgi:hypothetical protein